MTENLISIVVSSVNEEHDIHELLQEIDQSLPEEVFHEVLVVEDESFEETSFRGDGPSREHPVRILEDRDNSTVFQDPTLTEGQFIVFIDINYPISIGMIPELVAELRRGHDICVGRYQLVGNYWKKISFRTFISTVESYIVLTLFREARSVGDISSGFFAFKKDVVGGKKLNPHGSDVLLKILINGDYESISEVNYPVDNTKKTKKKIGFRPFFNRIRQLIQLSWRDGAFGLIAKFCLVGGLGVLVNLAVLTLLTEFGLYYVISGALGIEAGVLWSFTFNKLWTYRHLDISGIKDVSFALGRDHLVRSGGMLLNLFVLWFLTERFGIHYLLSQVIGIGLATTWNFVGNQWWTWQGHGN